MKLQFVMMRINNLQIPMIKADGQCYVTQKTLEKLLGVKSSTIRWTFKNRRDEFDGVSVNDIHANGNCVNNIHANELSVFIKENRKLLGINYVRGDMHLWSEHDMLTFTMLIRGPKGKELRSEIIQFIKDNALYESVPRSQFEEQEEKLKKMEKELSWLRGEIEALKPYLKEWSKISSKSLRMQSNTKRLREVAN